MILTKASSRKKSNKSYVVAVLVFFSSLIAANMGHASTGEFNYSICNQSVTTTEGPIQGVGNDGYCHFYGIPYAAPPVGELRWKAPQPAQTRNDLLVADQYGSNCIELITIFPNRHSKPSEDCLYLNIWRPEKEGDYPVMLFLHGGAWLLGSGSWPIYDGRNFARNHDVVVVTVNYRLGSFGYLYHEKLANEDPNGSSGNYGLLDQIAALKWVQQNIDEFGGDKNNVTVFGESAGGGSVCHFMASSLTSGLFHKGIMQSGLCDFMVNDQTGGAIKGHAFSESMGCSEAEDELACLRNLPTSRIKRAFTSSEFTPHIDGYVLKQSASETIKQGRFNNVPLMAGNNRAEHRTLTGFIPTFLIPNFLVKSFAIGNLDEQDYETWKTFYPKEKYRGRLFEAYIESWLDSVLVCSTYDALDYASLYQSQVYYSQFDHDQQLLGSLIGGGHGLELPFVFNSVDLDPVRYIYPKRATALAETMNAAWSRFAKYGDPSGENLDWPSYSQRQKWRMHFDVESGKQLTKIESRCEFWRNQKTTGN